MLRQFSVRMNMTHEFRDIKNTGFTTNAGNELRLFTGMRITNADEFIWCRAYFFILVLPDVCPCVILFWMRHDLKLHNAMNTEVL